MTDFGQLLRFAQMYDHYQDHLVEDFPEQENFNFADFLFLHFFNLQDHPQADHEDDHQKLPLKSLDVQTSLLLYFLPKQDEKPVMLQMSTKIIELKQLSLKGFPRLIFHPPMLS